MMRDSGFAFVGLAFIVIALGITAWQPIRMSKRPTWLTRGDCIAWMGFGMWFVAGFLPVASYWARGLFIAGVIVCVLGLATVLVKHFRQPPTTARGSGAI